MDELQGKRDKKYRKENKFKFLEMLSFLANKEEIKAYQETFEVNSIQRFRRMEELIFEFYPCSTLILKNIGDYDHGAAYLTIFKVDDIKKLPNVLNEILNQELGEKYTLTEELLMWPNCLSFSNENKKLFLMNYDGGIIEV